MARNQVAPEKHHRSAENVTEKLNNQKPKLNVTKRDKFFKSSASNSRNFSRTGNEPDLTSNIKHKDFFLKPNTKVERSKNVSEKIKSDKQSNELNKDKKHFDKKRYRLEKYSKKYKLQQWEDRRKHAIIQEYYRQTKNDQPVDVSKIYEDSRYQDPEDDKVEEENQNNLNANITETPRDSSHSGEKTSKIKTKPFQRAQQEFHRVKEEKLRKKEEFLKNKAEKQEAIKKYKKQKAEKYKKLSRKTKKGQPIMKNRIEMLLEKIQNSVE